jgi:DNA mismatch endonuclease (patch repair protein)
MDNLTKQQRKVNMQNIRSKNTGPERMIAKALRQRHIRYSQHLKSLPGKPDFVFRKDKTVLFIDSDFWHGNPKYIKMPKSNISYWAKKISRNIERDKEVTKLLKRKGWKVLRLWEHDINKKLNYSLSRIIKQLTL